MDLTEAKPWCAYASAYTAGELRGKWPLLRRIMTTPRERSERRNYDKAQGEEGEDLKSEETTDEKGKEGGGRRRNSMFKQLRLTAAFTYNAK